MVVRASTRVLLRPSGAASAQFGASAADVLSVTTATQFAEEGAPEVCLAASRARRPRHSSAAPARRHG
jgi:hypothetical protein